jgi:hypothetical protein
MVSARAAEIPAVKTNAEVAAIAGVNKELISDAKDDQPERHLSGMRAVFRPTIINAIEPDRDQAAVVDDLFARFRRPGCRGAEKARTLLRCHRPQQDWLRNLLNLSNFPPANPVLESIS